MPATPALRDEYAFVLVCEIVEDLAGLVVVYNGPNGNFDGQVRAAPALAIAPFAVPASLRAERVIESEFQQSVFVGVGNEIDVAAAAAVATARTAARNELFAAKGDTAVPAITGFDCDFSFV